MARRRSTHRTWSPFLHPQVTVQDAVVAVGLMEATAAAEGRSVLFPPQEAGGPAGNCFPEQPDREHARREKALLDALAVEGGGGLALPW